MSWIKEVITMRATNTQLLRRLFVIDSVQRVKYIHYLIFNIATILWPDSNLSGYIPGYWNNLKDDLQTEASHWVLSTKSLSTYIVVILLLALLSVSSLWEGIMSNSFYFSTVSTNRSGKGEHLQHYWFYG